SWMMPLISVAILPRAPFGVMGIRTEKLPFLSSRSTRKRVSVSSGDRPWVSRRSAPVAEDGPEPFVPGLEAWRPVTLCGGRRGRLVLGTAYCIQNGPVKVKQIMVPRVTKIGQAYQSPTPPNPGPEGKGPVRSTRRRRGAFPRVGRG